MKTRTNTTLIAIAAGLMTLSAVPVSAAPQQQHHQSTPSTQGHNSGSNGGQHSGGQNNSYGTWNSSWGARPSAPPRHFTRTGDWYRHVHACQQRFRSYNASTDRYTVRRGQTAICTL